MKVADFSSRCGICDAQIDEGDEIKEVDGEWCHAECAEGDS